VLIRTHKTQPHSSTAYFEWKTSLSGHMHITVRLPPPLFFAHAKAKDVNRESTTVRGTYSKHYDLDSRKQQSRPVTFKNNTPDLITSTPLRYLSSKPNFYWDSFI